VPDVELTERFADVVVREPLPLDEACALIGAHGEPRCDVDETLERLDAIADRVGSPDLDGLCATLFGDCGFAGDRGTYHDPRNSYLHQVLERRRGLPITLSVVLMEVGRRVGVDVVGIGTPAHFLTRTREEPHRYVDAFGGGRVLDRGELAQLFAAIAPGLRIDRHLAPVVPTDIVRRVLTNLVAVHQRRHDRDALRWSAELRTMVPGSSADDHRSFGAALAASGDFVRAAKVLESIVEDGRASDPEQELAEARRLRARLN
jgi:regulator of sirC expression with transglutaminase-like and TPR domain